MKTVKEIFREQEQRYVEELKKSHQQRVELQRIQDEKYLETLFPPGYTTCTECCAMVPALKHMRIGHRDFHNKINFAFGVAQRFDGSIPYYGG